MLSNHTTSAGPGNPPQNLVSEVTDISLATISGSVIIGPLCAVDSVERPCPVLDLSDRFLVLTSIPSGIQVRIQLSSDGGFEEAVLPGSYIIILQPCGELGCSRVFPQEISLAPGSSTVFNFEIDTGIR